MSRRKKSTIALALLITACGVALQARTQENSRSSVPTQVFVVNTQDASVSLVDLKGMKETRRFQVGPRPYGVAVSLDGKTVAVGVEDEEKVKFYDTADFKLKGEARISFQLEFCGVSSREISPVCNCMRRSHIHVT